jgi:hypothetical protein
VKAGGKQRLKMEATCSFEKLVDFQLTTYCYVPEHRTLDKQFVLNVSTFFLRRFLPAMSIVGTLPS